MSMKLYMVLFLWLAISIQALGQSGEYEYFITVNGNLYLPINNADKGVYPIIAYDKETSPKLLIGGLGAGISAYKTIHERLSLKPQVNLSKHTYWDKPIVVTNGLGTAIFPFLSGSSDYSLGIAATIHYFLTKNISFGTGLGGQVLLLSLSRIPDTNYEPKTVAVNRYYKPFMPTLPVELSCKFKSKMFNIRYEHGLLNRYRGDLKDYSEDKFGLLTFEVGFKINN